MSNVVVDGGFMNHGEVIMFNRLDLDCKLNAVVNFAVEYMNGAEDKLNVGISWHKYNRNDNNEKRCINVVWNFNYKCSNDIEYEACMRRQHDRVNLFKEFLKQRGFSNIWSKITDGHAIIFF